MTYTARSNGRRIIVLATALTTVAALSACSSGGGSPASSSGAVTSLRVADYYTDEPARSIIGDALDSCGASIGVTIEREAVPSSDYLSKILQQSSSRTLPDVQMIDAQDLPAIADSGALSPVADRDVPIDNVGESVLSLGTVDNEVYGLAPTVGTIVLFTNDDLLAEAGLSAPTTWEELKSTAAALTSGDQYGLAFSAKNDGQGTYAYLPLLWSAGGSEDELDSDAAKAALQLEVDLVSSGSASQSSVQWGNSDVGDQFLTGKAAMAITSATQMSKLDADPDVNYTISAIPVPEVGDTAIAPLGGEVWTLPLSGDDAREAAAGELLSCMMSDDTQLSLAEQRRVVPANPDLDEQYLTALPTLGSYVDIVRDGRSRTAILEGAWPQTNTAIWTAVQSAVTGQSSVDQALSDAAASAASAK
nr:MULTISPECIES: extracellular solute-binding protein [unclassified Rathayibacter]